MLFCKLGHIDQETLEQFKSQFKESVQFITAQSLNKNLHHVFGI